MIRSVNEFLRTYSIHLLQSTFAEQYCVTVFALSVKTDGVHFKKDRFSYVYDIPNFLGVLSCNASVNSICAQPLPRAIFLRPLQETATYRCRLVTSINTRFSTGIYQKNLLLLPVKMPLQQALNSFKLTSSCPSSKKCRSFKH